MAKRIITTENLEEDVKIESHLRPTLLKDYIGQEKAKETLKIYIEAAKARGESRGSCVVLWSSGTWEDDSCRNHCK